MKRFLDMAVYNNLMKPFLYMGSIPPYVGLQKCIHGVYLQLEAMGVTRSKGGESRNQG
jgi:hypothetical protein